MLSSPCLLAVAMTVFSTPVLATGDGQAELAWVAVSNAKIVHLHVVILLNEST